jgi:hypothetical protein
MKLLNDKELPNVTKSRTDKVEPKYDIEKMENVEPKRA